MNIQIILTEPLKEVQKKRFRAMLKSFSDSARVQAVRISGEKSVTSVKKIMKESKEDFFVFFGNDDGRYLGMKAAAELGYYCFTDVLDLEKGRIHKKIYSTHADGYFKIPRKKTVMILLPGGPASETYDERIDSLNPEIYNSEKVNSETRQIVKEKEKQDSWGLDKAELVFIGGRGLKKKENFELLVEAGKKYGASVGCTRAAALAGWADYSRVVGVSGSQIRPQICVLFGVSGAAPFLFGIENARTVIAINKDEKAPVFDAADYGIIRDCIPVVKGLMEGE